MSKPSQLLQFARQHVWGSILAAAGAVIAVGSAIRDIYDAATFGLPNGVWQAAGLIIFFLATAILLFRFDQSLAGNSPRSKENIPEPLPPAEPTARQKPPKVFYSQGDKNRISDRLYELTELFRTIGASMAEKYRLFDIEWASQSQAAQRGVKPNAAPLRERLRAFIEDTISLNRAVYDENGFLKGPDHVVMLEILQLDQNPNPISDLQSALNSLDEIVDVLGSVEGRRQIETMMQKVFAIPLSRLRNADTIYRAWVDACRRRIDELKQEWARE